MICIVFVCEYLEGSWAFTLIFIVFVCEGLVGQAPWIQRQRVCPFWGKKDGSSASLRLRCGGKKDGSSAGPRYSDLSAFPWVRESGSIFFLGLGDTG